MLDVQLYVFTWGMVKMNFPTMSYMVCTNGLYLGFNLQLIIVIQVMRTPTSLNTSIIWEGKENIIIIWKRRKLYHKPVIFFFNKHIAYEYCCFSTILKFLTYARSSSYCFKKKKRKKGVILNNRYISRVIVTQFLLLRKGISYLLEKGNKVCLHLEEVATLFMFMNKTN